MLPTHPGRRPWPTVLLLVLTALLLALAAMVLVAPPVRAGALGGGEPSNYRTRILAVRPPVPGLSVEGVAAGAPPGRCPLARPRRPRGGRAAAGRGPAGAGVGPRGDPGMDRAAPHRRAARRRGRRGPLGAGGGTAAIAGRGPGAGGGARGRRPCRGWPGAAGWAGGGPPGARPRRWVGALVAALGLVVALD